MFKYTEEQKEQIKLGLDDDLNILLYMNPEYTPEQMCEIRLGLKDDLDVSLYADPKIDVEEMQDIRTRLKYGLDIVDFNSLTPAEAYMQTYKDLDTMIEIAREQREKINDLKRQKYGGAR